MAEVVPDVEHVPTSTPPSSASCATTTDRCTQAAAKQKVGRRSKFSAEDDLIIVQEVAAAEAHNAPHGETQSRFEKAACKAKLNPSFKHDVSWKDIQDRFKKLLEDYTVKDGKDRNMSETGGEIGELDQLLGDILEAKRDKDAVKIGNAKEKLEQEEKSLAAGKEVILNAMKGKDQKEKGSSNETPTKRALADYTDGMSAISDALKSSDQARYELEKDNLAFMRQKLDMEAKERAADREERASERRERAEEMKAQREMTQQMMRDSQQQVASVLQLAGTLIAQLKKDKSALK